MRRQITNPRKKARSREYCALIGDINKSRNLRDRASIQRKFHDAIRILNAEFKKEIAARFMVTLGDEFQGLLFSPAESYRMALRFTELMHPIPFSFGVGIGTISTAFHRLTISMDGEVFHRARNALELSKQNRSLLTYEFNHPVLPMLNALIDLVDKQKGKLTPRQRTIARLLLPDGNQSRVARRLKISQPSVWKSVSSSNMKQLKWAEEALTSFLSSLR